MVLNNKKNYEQEYPNLLYPNLTYTTLHIFPNKNIQWK